MKIGLLSDTHGWLDPALLDWFAGAAMILHAGDVGSETILHELGRVAPTLAVRGNVDGGPWARELPLTRLVRVGGLRVAMLHIAGNAKKPHRDALALIAREHPELLLVGHSHIPQIARRDGVLWVNPGAAGQQGFHKERTAMLLHLSDTGKQDIDFIRLATRG